MPVSERDLRLSGLLAGALVLSSCSVPEPPPPVGERARSYAIEPERAEERVRAALRSAGFTVDEAPAGRIRARLTYDDARDWAWCPSRWVNERGGNRRQLARPLDWTARVDAGVAGEAGGSRVVVEADFEQTLLNGFINWELQNACRSTGALERMVLDAVARSA